MRLLVAGCCAAALLLFFACSDDEPSGPAAARPSVTTVVVDAITATTAQSGGNVTDDNGADVTARGVCWSVDSAPTILDDHTTDGSGTGAFVSAISGLTSGRTYHVRAYATNSVGTGYGDEVSFETNVELTDIDGNTYSVVKIGDHWWMAENLKVTRYRNGDDIPLVTNGATWSGLSSGAVCNYANEEANADVYGRLYNWFAVEDDRNLAPEGWHVPTSAEYQALEDHLGGDSVAGGRMMEIGTAHWEAPNTGATNESGFTALPAGHRYGGNGNYFDLTLLAMFWTSTESSADHAWNRSLEANDQAIYDNDFESKKNGFSVRCVKD